uniref:LysM domain-containing protein n=1 Tax=Parastrongyloides trichosuri TaxID=131310 RepID=A0A0N4ZLN6_PARTI
MQKLLVLTLLALIASTVYCGSGSGSGSGSSESSEAKDMKHKKECADDVVNESGSTGKPLLIEALYNISITLTVEEKVIFEQFIIELEGLFISENYTSIEIVMESSFKIKLFFLKYPQFYVQWQYIEIGSWGTFNDLFQVGVYLSADKFTGCFVHNEFGKFDLIEAFLEFQLKCGDASGFETYISQLTLILESTTYTESEKYSLIYELILQIIAIGNETLTYAEKIKAISYQYRQFIKTYPYLEEIFLSFEISAEFGTFGDFLAMFAFGESQGSWPESFITLPEISTEVPTTEAVSTVPATGNCGTAGNYILQVADGTSILWQYASATYSNWAAIEKANWKSLCSRVYTNFVINTSLTETEKVNSIIAEINAYVAFYYYREANVYAIQLGAWGTIGQLCAC